MAADCPWWAPPVLAVQFLTRLPVPGTQGLSPGVVATGLVRAVGRAMPVGAEAHDAGVVAATLVGGLQMARVLHGVAGKALLAQTRAALLARYDAA